MTDGIDAIAPPPTVTVQVGDRALVIAPASVRALAGMLRDGGDVFAAIGTLPLLALFAQHADGLIAIAAHGSGLTRDEVAALPGDAFFTLLGAVIEINADFFAHRLLPAMQQMMEAAARGMAAQAALEQPSTH